MSNTKLTACERLDIIRHKGRPTALDYIPMIFDEFFEMHGDRLFGDDGAVMGGIASFKGTPVTLIAEVKGRNLSENQKCNFGMPHPEGYRKALRLARQAEKFRRPVICFVDTAGAFCGVDAEKRGQGEAIARNIMEFMTLKTPVITIILGEGGSGGALALAVCDRLAMLENAMYSVISPRGFASILWKDATREREAAEIMKITADDLVRLGVCDDVIPEADGGAHTDPQQTAENISDYISKTLDNLQRKFEKGLDEMINQRYNKFRVVGEFELSSHSDIPSGADGSADGSIPSIETEGK
ncbi:MAG: acetyl-CoA carboxylase carboxyltransferase subunit alpha [Ruminococcus sp.]|nr:acetyl-CoA carboxylase carboxyltransferase subunit alpha [Ruminococcus sp.]